MVIFDICFGDEAGLVKTLGNRNNTGIYIYGNRIFWEVFGNRHFWAFSFLCSVIEEHLFFFPCNLIAGQVTHLSSLPRDSTEYATLGLFWDPHWVYISVWNIFSLLSSGQFCFTVCSGFQRKRAFQIFPVALPHILCAPVGTSVSRPCGSCEVAMDGGPG